MRPLFIVFIQLCFLLPGTGCVLASGRTLKVGIYDNPPKVFINEQGRPDGIFIDVIESIAEAEEWDIVYIEGDWSQLQTMLIAGTLDVLPDMAYSASRDSTFTLGTLSVLGSWLEAFVFHETRLTSILDFEGKRIGVLSGSIQEEYLNTEVMERFQLNYELIPFDDYTTAVQALELGSIDIMVAGRFFYFSDLCNTNIHPTGIILRPTELHLAFPKNIDPTVVQVFDKGLSELKNDPHSIYYSSIQQWFDKQYVGDIPRFVPWFIGFIAAGLIIALAFVALLRYQIKEKTKSLVRKNEELIRAKLKAEESERLKTVFLQNMSHEIRTPMNGVISFLDLLKDPELDTESRNSYIDIVNKSGKRLLDTINNIIEISRIESGQFAVNRSEVNLQEVMEYQAAFFRELAREKQNEIVLEEYIKGDEALIECDKSIIDNILTNLINNANKFTSKGRIGFGNRIKGNAIEFYVSDTGMGIPKDRHEAIFERFVQADLNITRPHEGSGLGLSIVKAYLEKIGGKISVVSEPGKGSTFVFSITYRPLHAEGQSLQKSFAAEGQGGEGVSILVAEDDDISYFLIERLLRGYKIDLHRAKNGAEAVKLMKSRTDISMVLMDIKMPEMDGLEATAAIRKFNKSVPIIAHTAYTVTEDHAKAMEAGCSDYLSKPIDRSRLLQLVHEYTLVT